MKLDTLQALYVEELKDLYNAENQILKALPKMIRAAEHPELKEAFTDHMKQTQNHVKRLEQIFGGLDESPKGKKCHGMEGVLEEGAELIKEQPEPQVLDAGLISAAQHVEHYEMAGYGAVRTWAEKLGRDEDARLLQETLDEEHEANELLTTLALRSINIDADREVGLPAGSEITPRRSSKSKPKLSATPQPPARR
jgi:ferritin-like metal-binding protein YciE